MSAKFDLSAIDGLENDLVDRIAADPAFRLTREEILGGLKSENFIGFSVQQTEDYLRTTVDAILEKEKGEVRVKEISV